MEGLIDKFSIKSITNTVYLYDHLSKLINQCKGLHTRYVDF